MGPYLEVCARPARHSRPRSTRTSTHDGSGARTDLAYSILLQLDSRSQRSTATAANTRRTARRRVHGREGERAPESRVHCFPSFVCKMSHARNAAPVHRNATFDGIARNATYSRSRLAALRSRCRRCHSPPQRKQYTRPGGLHLGAAPPPDTTPPVPTAGGAPPARRGPRPLTCDSRTPDGMRPFPAR